jgi:hypothetical protein
MKIQRDKALLDNKVMDAKAVVYNNNNNNNKGVDAKAIVDNKVNVPVHVEEQQKEKETPRVNLWVRMHGPGPVHEQTKRMHGPCVLCFVCVVALFNFGVAKTHKK